MGVLLCAAQVGCRWCLCTLPQSNLWCTPRAYSTQPVDVLPGLLDRLRVAGPVGFPGWLQCTLRQAERFDHSC
jgi:hypothetical protein